MDIMMVVIWHDHGGEFWVSKLSEITKNTPQTGLYIGIWLPTTCNLFSIQDLEVISATIYKADFLLQNTYLAVVLANYWFPSTASPKTNQSLTKLEDSPTHHELG